MSLLNLFGKKSKDQLPQNKEATETTDIEIYSGMRVEVMTDKENLLFVAKLLGLRENKAELHQYSEMELPQQEEPLHVQIRGYNDRSQKAVYMEGVITPDSKNIWKVEELTVSRTGNDRAFFRLNTDLDATATTFSGLTMGEKPCKMLNISVGGARIRSEYKYHEGDQFLLKVKLMEDAPESAMYCQVLRIIEKNNQKFEYGCKFLELTEKDQEKILQNIFAVQLQKRGRS
ncbi:MAG: PilZ domain-containing protein [Firmicutes bacterium]|nr:PilZ domain-containing protein [Bacillota bacterium]